MVKTVEKVYLLSKHLAKVVSHPHLMDDVNFRPKVA